jgi:hypothetical protein
METQFRIKLYAKVLNSIHMGCRRILNFMKVIQATCLPGEGNKPGLADVQFPVVSGTPSLYMFDISLQQSAVISR